jgi:hypothetical protein
LTARTSRSESASESASSEVLDGDGLIGDSIGVAISRLLGAEGTTPGAARFITGTPSTEVEARAAKFTTVPARRAGLSTHEVEPRAAEFTTVPAQRRDHSTETRGLLEATLRPAVRAASAQAPSAASGRADRQEAFRHVEGPASVAGEFVAAVEQRAAVAGVGNRSFVIFLVACKI